MKFNHVGLPTEGSFDGEIRVPHLQITCSDHRSNPYGVQWMNYWDGAPYPELVKTVAHVAFEVDDLAAELEGKTSSFRSTAPARGSWSRSSTCKARRWS